MALSTATSNETGQKNASGNGEDGDGNRSFVSRTSSSSGRRVYTSNAFKKNRSNNNNNSNIDRNYNSGGGGGGGGTPMLKLENPMRVQRIAAAPQPRRERREQPRDNRSGGGRNNEVASVSTDNKGRGGPKIGGSGSSESRIRVSKDDDDNNDDDDNGGYRSGRRWGAGSKVGGRSTAQFKARGLPENIKVGRNEKRFDSELLVRGS